jgi:hypothetical protein
MTTAVQNRRGTTAEHSTFTGLEGEVTIDTTKDTAVIHDGTLAGGYPLAKENLANVTTSGLSSIDGASTASDDKFFIYDQSATSLKTITRAELNNAIEQDALANVAITGGTINGTAIGSTTAAAGAFTTLTTSSTVTHNGGTANGVAYLNGSKVLTTGSALTFDGTRLGIGVSPTQTIDANGTILSRSNLIAYTALVLQRSSSSLELPVATYTNGSGSILSGGTKGDIVAFGNTGGDGVIFANSNAEAMRLTSTGLGIGTSSPGYKLDVTVGSLSGAKMFKFSGASGQSMFGYVDAGGVGITRTDPYNSMVYLSTSNTVEIYTASTQRAVFDSSGNLGIGTTSPAYKLHVLAASGYTAAFRASTAATTGVLVGNTAGDTAIQTLSSGNSLIGSDTGKYLAFGTNGFVERMRLDSSGNLGLGVTPSAWVGNTAAQIGPLGAIASSTSTPVAISANAYSTSAGWAARYITSSTASLYLQLTGQHQWYTAPSGTAGDAISFSQVMTLDASGVLLVGKTSNSTYAAGGALFAVNGATDNGVSIAQSNATGPFITFFNSADSGFAGFSQTAAGTLTVSASSAFTFSVNSAERARIDSSGNLLVGRTDVITFSANSNNGVVLRPDRIDVSAASVARITQIRDSTGTLDRFYNGADIVGSITCTTTATAYNTSSDYRLKNTIAPMTGALAKVALLKPCTYKWNADGSDGEGFIAHELQAVVPQCVTGQKDAVDAEGKPQYQGIDTSFLVATLTAALQEAVAEINSLKARLDAANL